VESRANASPVQVRKNPIAGNPIPCQEGQYMGVVIVYAFDLILVEARIAAVPSFVKRAAHTSQRVGQLFSGHPAYNVLIKYDRSGFYWLDL
jgi:hypothetical protein